MKVIIDAANVAHFHKEEGSKAKLKNITLAVKALEEGGHDFLIIADASLRHNIDDKETFVRLVNDGIIDEVPVGTIADHYILDLAYEEDAKVLSNDKFRDFMSEFPDINSIRIPFSIQDNELVMGKAKKPKKVKNLLQNICDETLNELERKRWVVYKGKETTKFTPLNVAKQAILLLDESEQDNVSSKIEGIFSKLPMFDKVMEMVDDVETSVPYVIFVLVHPKDYKAAVKDAGNWDWFTSHLSQLEMTCSSSQDTLDWTSSWLMRWKTILHTTLKFKLTPMMKSSLRRIQETLQVQLQAD